MKNLFRAIPGARSAWWYIRTVLLIILAISAALFAILALRPTPAGHPVVVAAVDIEAGHEISARDIRLSTVPESAIPTGALTETQQVVGETTQVAVPARTVLTPTVLGTSGDADLQPGHSKVQLRIAQDQLFVDPPATLELWGRKASCGSEECPLEKLASSAQLIAVSPADSSGTFSGEKTVVATLIVPNHQVSDILETANHGELHLVMRS